MNKAELVEVLTGRLGDRKSAQAALDAVLEEIQRAVSKGDKVSVAGFGVFEKRARAARMARNPRTGEAVKVKKTSVPAFRPGQGFKDLVSGAAKPAPAAKSSAKKTASKSAAKKTAAKKATTKKKATVKKTAAKKTTAPATKAATRKTATRVTKSAGAAKKTVKAAAKSTTKKATTTKAVAAKKTAKKTAKKATKKK